MKIDDTIICAGDMRQRIEIQATAIASQNSYGEAVTTETTTNTVWAEARPLSGNEQLVAKQINASVSFVFILRYLAAVTTTHQVLYRDRTFDINAVLNVGERQIKTVLLCTEAT